MKAKNFANSKVWRTALIAAAVAISGCDAANEAIDEINDIGNDAEVFYYVSLGTSLSVGVQPNGSGVLLPTDDGKIPLDDSQDDSQDQGPLINLGNFSITPNING